MWVNPLFISINLEPVCSGFSLLCNFLLGDVFEAATMPWLDGRPWSWPELTDTVGSVAQSLQLEESLVVGKPPQKKMPTAGRMFEVKVASYPLCWCCLCEEYESACLENTFKGIQEFCMPNIIKALCIVHSMPTMKGSSVAWTTVWSSWCEEFMVLLDEVGAAKMQHFHPNFPW